jgi:hypothetical protein
MASLGAGLALAQVYETRDAEGNPVFSDTPSPTGKEIVVPEANISDPVRETAAPVDTSADAQTSGDNESNVILIGDESAGRENEFIDNEGRREVLEAEKRQEVLDAEPRHEVR